MNNSKKSKLKAKRLKQKKKEQAAFEAKKTLAKSNLKKDLKRAKKRAKYDLNLLELKEALPAGFGGTVNSQTLDLINKTIRASNSGENMREYIIGFSDVLGEGKFSIEQYISAVKFARFKMMGYNNEKSYKKTFPKRTRELKKKRGLKGIQPYVASYFKGKLVQGVLAQTMIPPSLFFQDTFYDAVIVQAKLMKSKNEYVQQKASQALMEQLRPPEKVDKEIDAGTNGAAMLNSMLSTLLEVTDVQHKLIKAKKVFAKQVIEGDYTAVLEKGKKK